MDKSFPEYCSGRYSSSPQSPRKYVLYFGCWDGTVSSIDLAEPEEFEDLSEAIARCNQTRAEYRARGLIPYGYMLQHM